MDAPLTPPIFDGHNDLLLALQRAGRDAEARFATGLAGHVDLPKARAGGFAGGIFALFAPSADAAGVEAAMARPPYDIALPPRLKRSSALDTALAQAAILMRLERAGFLTICRAAAAVGAAIGAGRLAAVMHLEGAEAIDADLDALEVLHGAGLRSLGPVWSRPNRFGYGVAFRFPGDPEQGPGLTEAGRRLVAACHARGIVVDVSHLNAAGFRDVAAMAGAPIVATHSNAHALCRHARNLTDWQLDAIRESDGMVGVNLAAAFLRPDGRMRADTPLDTVLDQFAYLIDRLGEGRVGLGSDFDGAVVPAAIGSVAGLGALRAGLAARGIGPALMERLCWRNWVDLLARVERAGGRVPARAAAE